MLHRTAFATWGCRLAAAAVTLTLLFGFAAGQAARATETENLGIKPFPFVHPLFSDNMVLPRDVPAPVWGWTTPGAKVTVSIAGKNVVATADENGRWLAKVGPFQASDKGQTLTITGPQTVTIENVVVGDVWLCAGQSNMYMLVKDATGGLQEAATADFPAIRLMSVPAYPNGDPQPVFRDPVCWQVASPATVKEHSAVAFFFGRHLHQNVKIPVGLIHSSAGATGAEAWLSAEALATVAGGKEDLGNLATWKELMIEWAAYDADPAMYKKKMTEWYVQNDPGSATEPGWADPALADAEWKTIKLPGSWRSALGGFEGVAWFRKSFDLPEALQGKDVVIFLGQMDRRDTVWINGVQVGQSDSNGWVRQYRVDAKLLKPTGNLVAVRILGGSGFQGNAANLKIVELSKGAPDPGFSLVGDWKCQAGVSLREATKVPSLRSGNPNIPTALFNGAVAPLTPFAIKGAVWYQGESSVNNPGKYKQLLPALISDWRARFASGDFPFLIVQLPNFGETHAAPSFSGWVQLREVQARIARTIPNCGLAVTVDIGDPKDVHPRNKLDVGLRLGLLARAMVYGQKIPSSGPVFSTMDIDGANARLSFDHADGLAIHGSEATLQGFAVAGADRRFVWAEAVIEKGAVVVSSPQVAVPVAVRYACDDSPVANLVNKTGLPAAPFRTDNW